MSKTSVFETDNMLVSKNRQFDFIHELIYELRIRAGRLNDAHICVLQS